MLRVWDKINKKLYENITYSCGDCWLGKFKVNIYQGDKLILKDYPIKDLIFDKFDDRHHIYENDIIQCFELKKGIVCNPVGDLFLIKGKTKNYKGKTEEFCGTFTGLTGYIKVLGNTHKNPELISKWAWFKKYILRIK